MWRDRQVKLLKQEIEEVLFSLSDAPDLYALVTESLEKAGQGLANESGNTHPWPLLPLIVCEAISGYFKHALPVAAAFYLLEKAAETFDDIEDSDSSEALSAKYGSAMATNVGTTLLILAEKAVTRLKERGVEDKITIRVIDEVNSSFITACAGQHLDLSLSLNVAVSEDMYIQVSAMKSASIIGCTCRVGALLATENQQLIDMFAKYGYYLGIVSQIANDILGITQENDILKPKITLPMIYALNQVDNEARDILELSLSRRSEASFDPKSIKDLLFRTGAIHYSTIKMEFYKQQALDVLSKLVDEDINVERLKLFLI